MNEFERELKVFQTEEEYAQQAFFAHLSVRDLAATDEHVRASLTKTPLFWATTHHAMLVAAFVTLGRIFDQDQKKSDQNVDKLILVTGENLNLFTKEALLDRKIAAGVSRKDAENYTDKHELTSGDVRTLRKKVREWRRIYEPRYRTVRHVVYAHKKAAGDGRGHTCEDEC